MCFSFMYLSQLLSILLLLTASNRMRSCFSVISFECVSWQQNFRSESSRILGDFHFWDILMSSQSYENFRSLVMLKRIWARMEASHLAPPSTPPVTSGERMPSSATRLASAGVGHWTTATASKGVRSIEIGVSLNGSGIHTYRKMRWI